MRRTLLFLVVLALVSCKPSDEPKLPRPPEPPVPTALTAKPGPGVLIVCAPIPSPDYGDCCVGHGGNASVTAHGPVMCADGAASEICRCE